MHEPLPNRLAARADLPDQLQRVVTGTLVNPQGDALQSNDLQMIPPSCGRSIDLEDITESGVR